MFLPIEHRLSDSPLVDRVWRSHSERAGMVLSVAASHIEMVVTRHRGKTFLTLRGPETKATTADYHEDSEWLGIRFKLGTFIPALLPNNLLDRRDVTLPGASTRAFWLDGSAWEYPGFENAEIFVSRLVRNGVIARDSIVEAVMHGHSQTLSLRSTQRHFLHATGITSLDVAADRTRQTCDESPAGRCVDSRCRISGRLLRSAALDPIAPAADGANAGGDHPRPSTVVVSVQNGGFPQSLRYVWMSELQAGESTHGQNHRH